MSDGLLIQQSQPQDLGWGGLGPQSSSPSSLQADAVLFALQMASLFNQLLEGMAAAQQGQNPNNAASPTPNGGSDTPGASAGPPATAPAIGTGFNEPASSAQALQQVAYDSLPEGTSAQSSVASAGSQNTTTSGSGPTGGVGASSTVLLQPAGSLNVDQFNTKGDGASDDSDALQNAFNAAAQNGVGTVYIPPGIYNHSKILNVPDNVHVVGAGSSTILHSTNPSAEAIIMNGKNSSVSQLKTTVDAPTRSSDPDGAAILIGGNGDSASNLTIIGAQSNAVRVAGGSNASVQNDFARYTNADSFTATDTIGSGGRGSTDTLFKDDEGENSGDDTFSVIGNKSENENTQFLNDYSKNNLYGRAFSDGGGNGDIMDNDVSDGSRWYAFDGNSGVDSDGNHYLLPTGDISASDNLVLNQLPGNAAVNGLSPSSVATSGTPASVLGWNEDQDDTAEPNPEFPRGTGVGSSVSLGNMS